MSTAHEDERDEIEELLPWHAAGTLDPRDAQRVEAALAADAELARRFQLVREELGQTVYLNETLGAPSPRAIEALFAKIDAEPARRSQRSLNLQARIADFFASLSPRALAWSASAAAMAIVLQAGVIAGVLIKERNAASYETASAPTNAAADGAYALIRFQPDATAADVTQFLETNKLDIAGGPSAGGLYRVRVAPTKLSRTDLARIVQTLQGNKIIGFIAAMQ
jgi:anti-sigma factor RsiW